MKPIRLFARKLSRLALLAFLVSTGFVGVADVVDAAHIQCGTVLSQSGTEVTLDSDVGPCATDGIIITGDNITVNLNGFDVVGDSNPNTQNVGIRIHGTQDTVTDCSDLTDKTAPCTPGRQDSEVRDFNAGIVIQGGNSNQVCRTTIRRNVGLGLVADGIIVHQSNSNAIANNTVELNGHFSGITLLGDSDTNKLGTTIKPGNPDVDGATTRTSCDGGNTVRNNAVGPQDIGIRLEAQFDPAAGINEAPNGNVVQNNVVSGSTLDGIAHLFAHPTYTGSTSNTIESNTVSGNGFHPFPARAGDGIRLNGNPRLRDVAANQTTVEGNTVTGNAGNGITVNSQYNNIKANAVSLNGARNPAVLTEPGPEVQLGHGVSIGNDHNVMVQNNVTQTNFGDGINLNRAATNNNIKQNTVTGNVAGDGIDTELGVVGNNIMQNTATGNGIAAPLAFDLEDDNPNADPVPPCESNTWQSNTEVTKNQPCID